VFLILLFLSLAAGYFFSALFNQMNWDFYVWLGFYGLILAILLLFKKQIVERPVIRAIINSFSQKDDNEK